MRQTKNFTVDAQRILEKLPNIILYKKPELLLDLEQITVEVFQCYVEGVSQKFESLKECGNNVSLIVFQYIGASCLPGKSC